jgi:hypothetical protein
VALLLGLALSLGCVSRSQAATTWTVCASGCDYSSIKAAIAAPTTRDGDTLAIAAGTYTEAGIVVNKSLTLQGARAATTIVQAAAIKDTAPDRVFTIASGVTVTLQDLTVRYGRRTGSGGGLYNAGTLTLTHSTVHGNTASGHAGGLYNAGTLTLTHSTVSGNTSTAGGGGFWNEGTLTLTNSTVSDNTAYSGGGFYNYPAPLTLTRSTVSGNTASYGGGVFNEGQLTLTHSTVSGNTATGYGGGIITRRLLTLTSSIVASNPRGGDCSRDQRAVTSRGYNVDSDGSCQLTAPTDLPGHDPLLGPLQDHGGPAIDAIPWGTNGCGTTLIGDQRWQARPQPAGGTCDIGAYEVEVAGQPLSAWVAGLTPDTAVCKNVTTGQEVTRSDPVVPWDCEAAGLAANAGDRVALRVRGWVQQSATDIGGAVAGMTPTSGSCANLTTGQAVPFQHLVGATAASCEAAGLVVHPGDQVQMRVQGVAE